MTMFLWKTLRPCMPLKHGFVKHNEGIFGQREYIRLKVKKKDRTVSGSISATFYSYIDFRIKRL